jgi:TM2 domain-containing membrane protein YozV
VTDNPYTNVMTKPKETWIAYVLWLLLAPFGAHRFYLGRTGSAIGQLATSLTIIGLLVTAVWSIVDLFLIPGITREENAKLATEWDHRQRVEPVDDGPDPIPGRRSGGS